MSNSECMSVQEDFITIIKENQDTINSICKAYFPAPDDLKDARQDVILQLWRSFPSFRGEAKLSTWIYRVALNTLLSKRNASRSQIRNEPISENHLDRIAVSQTPDAFDSQTFTLLIKDLSDSDKAIIMLLLEGYTNKEIAAMLGYSQSNVSTRLNRIRQKLKPHYSNENR